MKMNRYTVTYCLIPTVLLLFLSPLSWAKNNMQIHPMNKKLMQMGLLDGPPKYYPEIPRITAQEALQLYKMNKALFILTSYHNQDQIVGGLHMTEGQYPKIADPNRLPFKKGQVLVFY